MTDHCVLGTRPLLYLSVPQINEIILLLSMGPSQPEISKNLLKKNNRDVE